MNEEQFNEWENNIVAESYEGDPTIFHANMNMAHKFSNKYRW